MNSKILTALTLATVAFLSFSSFSTTKNAPELGIKSSDSPAVVEDKMQPISETNSQPETIDLNSTPAQIPAQIPAQEPVTANSNSQTDLAWKEYLGGRKIVQFQNYSSGNGGGGISGKTEIHFCKNGQIIAGSQNSFTVNAGNSNINSSGQNGGNGTWKILESNQQAVRIQATDNSSGQTMQFDLAMGDDRKIYSNGNKFFPGPSDVCP